MELSANNIMIFTNGSNKNIPIIFVHGFPYDHTMWEKTVDALKDNYYCVTYDIRGLGQSPTGSGQYTIESFVDDLETIIDELKLKKPVLCGLSMGGYISLRAVERMEEKFAAVILCDTKPEADDNITKLKRAAGVKLLYENGAEEFIRAFVKNCFGTKYSEAQKSEYMKIEDYFAKGSPVAVSGCLIAMAARTDTTEALGKIKIPTLVICGEDDRLTPPAIMKQMAEKIKEAKFVLIPDAGHMTPIENPVEFNKAVTEFLEDL
ncbi:MAG: alpha/beta hydrolase [Ignavibacteriaceae bacterium]|nr:alpha/beta hydrolase [Ignavibacteriaceae bacterium]